MVEQTTAKWANIRARTLETPARRARYERTKRQIITTRRILQAIDAERQRRGMTKAALAQEIGMTPSVVRRMFSSEASNPGLVTVIAMLDALDLGVHIQRAPGRRRPANPLRRASAKRRPNSNSVSATPSAKERTTERELIST
jgi:transcriptional regulator with XRE-family HTH domain